MIYSLVNYLTEVLKLNLLTFGIFGCDKRRSRYVIFVLICGCLLTMGASSFSPESMTFIIFILVALTNIAFQKRIKTIWITVLSSLIISLVDGLIAGALCALFDIGKAELLNDSLISIIATNLSIPMLLLIKVIIDLNTRKNQEPSFSPTSIPKKNIALLIIGIISAILYLFPIQTIAWLSPNKETEVITTFVIAFSGLLFVVICALYFLVLSKNEHFRNENRMFIAQMEMQKRYYEALLKREEATKSLRHDIREHYIIINHHIAEGRYEDAKKYAAGLIELTNLGNTLLDTGSNVLNAVINDVWANADGVKLKLKGSLPEEVRISDIDICILFSNILKNALESTVKCESNRVVTLNLKQINGALHIHCENPLLAAAPINKGRLVSTKKDSEGHGLGLLNVEDVVKKYNGSIDINQTDMFVIDIVLEDAGSNI